MSQVDHAAAVSRSTDPPGPGPRYKWVALSNTTLVVLLATFNSSIVIIAMPDIFRGIHLNPLRPANIGYLLWIIMGYIVVSAVLVVTRGRLGDMANSTAILTDAFPAHRRGVAMGVNGVAGIGGSFIGFILGGLLAPISWRSVFLINVVIGAAGTVWTYRSLHEIGIHTRARITWDRGCSPPRTPARSGRRDAFDPAELGDGVVDRHLLLADDRRAGATTTGEPVRGAHRPRGHRRRGDPDSGAAAGRVVVRGVLGYNPIGNLLGSHIDHVSQTDTAVLTGKQFFPHLVAGPFNHGLLIVFGMSIALCLVSAIASALRGGKYVHTDEPGSIHAHTPGRT